jgi:hypothetical protein
MGRKINIFCKNLNKWFGSLGEAARFANADAWTMSKKMETAGGFVDKNGNEYIRQEPMKTKNQYKNTGKQVQKVLKRKRKVINKPIQKEEFVYGDLPKVVRDLIDEKIVEMCNQNKRWFEIKDFMLKMGCKSVTISIKDEKNAE